MKERTFVLHWLYGKDQTVKGVGGNQHEALDNACNNAGIRGWEIVAALDYWEEITDDPKFIRE